MSNNKKSTLSEFLLKFESVLTDGVDVYAGSSLTSGKGLEKCIKGRKKLADEDSDTPLVVIDTTVWGSVSEGFYITDKHIYAKSLYEDKIKFPIEELHSILVDEKEKKILINDKGFKWLGDTTTPKIQIIADCIQNYLQQRTSTGGAQVGFQSYIEGLERQLHDLHSNIFQWTMDVQKKAMEVSFENIKHMPSGNETFLERISIAASRSSAINSYDQLLKEAKNQINSLNNSIPIKHANKQLQDFDHDIEEFSFAFNKSVDRDTALSNENWQNNTENALNEITDCGNQLLDQIGNLTKKLKIIQSEASE